MANPAVGQLCTLSFGGGRVHPCVITKVVSGTNVNLAMLNDDQTQTWDDGVGAPGVVGVQQLANVAKGSGTGQWQDIVTPDPVLADMAAAVTAGGSSFLASAYSASQPSRSLNANFQPSATRPTLCVYTGTWQGSLSVTGSQTGTVELRSDSAATPTTARTSVVPAVNLALGLTVGSTINLPWVLAYSCIAGHNVRLVTSGTGTFVITSSCEIVM